MAQRVVVIGGDAGGMAAVSQIHRLRPGTEVIALERGHWTSYSACGIPYLVGGLVEGGPERLVTRSPEQHRANGIDVRMRHEATALDLDARTVEVHDLEGGDTYALGFDHLLLGAGGRPVRPSLPGIGLPFVRGVQTLDDGAALMAEAEALGCRRVVVVGGGYIGLEMAEAFLHRGCTSTVIDAAPHPLSMLEPELGALVATALEKEGVDVLASTQVHGFEQGVVHTSRGDVPADLVILGIGVRPNSELAADAGIALGVKDAVAVDDRQQTSVAGVWAAGDCAETTHLVTGTKVYIALGTYANRHARVAGINIGGGDAVAPRVLGTAVTKLCSTEIGLTGLNSRQAADAGFDAVVSRIESSTSAGYYPGASRITVSLVVERGTGRLLGGQFVGGPGSAKRVDTCATAITAGMDVQQVVDLDLGYAPPFSPVWDPLAVAAREALKLV
jgi:NADPH-dependent 2,4-dienoyl-CoA reductase/sulfur reductase-like enzyme